MTAHADICLDLVRRLQEADAELKADEVWALHYSDPNGNGEGKLWGEAAALIQKMAAELRDAELSRQFATDSAEIEKEAHLIQSMLRVKEEDRAESVESQLADLRAKIAAADAGLPSEPHGYTYETGTGVMVDAISSTRRGSLYFHASDYDELRTLATAQAVRIAEAEAGFPSYPLPHYLESDYESAWFSKKDFDALRDFAISLKVRIAESAAKHD